MAILRQNFIVSRINCCNSADQFTLSLYQCIGDGLSAPESYTLNNQHIKLSVDDVDDKVLTIDDNIPLPLPEGWLARDVRPDTLPRFLLTDVDDVPGMEISFIGTDDPRPCTDYPIHRIKINNDGIVLTIQGETMAIYIPPSAQELVRHFFSHPCL